MKKFILMLAAVAAMISCTAIEDPTGEIDFAKYLGQDKASVMAHFGEVTDLMGMFTYEYASGEVSMLTFMCGEDNCVMMISAVMRENIKPCAELKEYFAKNYKTVEDDGETYYTNNSDMSKATVQISVGGINEGVYYVYYMNPNSEGSGEAESLEMDADQLLKTFLGMDEDDFMDDYVDMFTLVQGMYSARVDDDMVSDIMLTINDGYVNRAVLFVEDATEDDVVAYFTSKQYEKLPMNLPTWCGSANGAYFEMVLNDGILTAEVKGFI